MKLLIDPAPDLRAIFDKTRAELEKAGADTMLLIAYRTVVENCCYLGGESDAIIGGILSVVDHMSDDSFKMLMSGMTERGMEIMAREMAPKMGLAN